MLGPLARSRALLGGALLLTAATAGVVLAPGTSATAAAATTTAYGPVAAAPPARPLIALDGPLLDVSATRQRAPVPRLGPRVVPPEVGPPGPVGPASPPARVRAVQRLLNAAGAQLRVDGAWGPRTAAAVRAVQAAAGLPVDGRAGPLTLELLLARRGPAAPAA